MGGREEKAIVCAKMSCEASVQVKTLGYMALRKTIYFCYLSSLCFPMLVWRAPIKILQRPHFAKKVYLVCQAKWVFFFWCPPAHPVHMWLAVRTLVGVHKFPIRPQWPVWEANGSFPVFLGLSTNGASQCNAFLWQLPFVTTILFQAQEYAMRAFNLAKEQQLSDHEQNTIQELLNLILAEEGYPII